MQKPRMAEVWTEGQGLHMVYADDDEYHPQTADYSDGDNPNPHWGDWHGVDAS